MLANPSDPASVARYLEPRPKRENAGAMSLRLRITLLTCGVVALVVMVIATVFFITVGARLRSDLDNRVIRRAELTENAFTRLPPAVLLAPVRPRVHGPGEAELTEIVAPDGTAVFFCRTGAGDSANWVDDFRPLRSRRRAPALGLARIDHVALSQPFGYFDEAALFYRTVLGFAPRYRYVTVSVPCMPRARWPSTAHQIVYVPAFRVTWTVPLVFAWSRSVLASSLPSGVAMWRSCGNLPAFWTMKM